MNEVTDAVGVAMLFGLVECLMLIYMTQYLYIKTGQQKLDFEEGAEAVSVVDVVIAMKESL